MERSPGKRSTSIAAPRAGIRLPGLGAGLGRGMVVLYLSPDGDAAAGRGGRRVARAAGSAPSGTSVTGDQAMAALKLTVICSLIVVAINAVFGTIIAWVLVRDEFPRQGRGQRR